MATEEEDMAVEMAKNVLMDAMVAKNAALEAKNVHTENLVAKNRLVETEKAVSVKVASQNVKI
jgi:hypothetical protein